jgi:hypothetical protein
MKIIHFLSAALFCLMLPGGAAAQSKVTTGLDPAGESYSSQYYLMMPDEVGIVLLRSAELGSDGFIMRLALRDAQVSCAKIGPLNVETSYDAIYMDLKIASYVVDMRDKNHCDKKPQIPSADVVLDRADLKARGISKVRVYFGNYSDTYTLDIGAHHVTLKPEKPISRRMTFGSKEKVPTIAADSAKPLAAYNVSTPLELWFLPQDLIMLYAPTLPQGQDASAEIMQLAKGRGLLPMEMDGFVKPRSAVDYHYFTDPQDMYLKTLEEDKGAPFGKIRMQSTVYGLRGDEVAYKSYDVYMKKPGLYE